MAFANHRIFFFHRAKQSQGASLSTPRRNQKKICYLIKTFPKISETFVLQEILGLEKAGYQLHILSLQAPSDRQSHDEVSQVQARVDYLDRSRLSGWRGWMRSLVQCLKNPAKTAKALALLSRQEPAVNGRLHRLKQAIAVSRLAESENFGHLHAHFASEPAAVAELVRTLTGLGFSISAHAKDIYLSPATALRRKMAAASFVVTCTEYNQRYLQRLNTAPTPVIRVYHGFDIDRFASLTNESAPPPATEPLILAVGRLRPKKGFDTLIASCAHLNQLGIGFHCEIVGYGPERETLQRQIDLAGLSDRVRLRGQLVHRQLIRLYQQASLFVLPCRIDEDGDRDGIPNVLMEAMAMGIAVVSTPISGIPELVQNQVNGLLVEPDHPQLLSHALASLLADPERRRVLGNAGRQRIIELFALAPNLAVLQRLFNQALENSPTPALTGYEEKTHAR